MFQLNTAREEHTGEDYLEVPLSGHALLHEPLLNKGSAFSEEERREFGLMGILPPYVSTIDEQVDRVYNTYLQKESDLERYIHLSSLHDRNETLFYRVLQEHIIEMVPIVYTPTVGAACQYYSHIFQRARGLYIPYSQQGEIDSMLATAPYADVRVIVVTDGERILGLGDLGLGGMGIPIGKLALYTLCAGIHPAQTLPIMLDVGTNNQELLTDSLYLGWRHTRVRGADYDAFIEAFVQGVMRRFPNAVLQWEDFAQQTARPILERYRDRLCTFNDDIQGTGAVTLAGLLAAVEVTGAKWRDQRVVMLGAGSAAIGISEQIVLAMMHEGISEAEAIAKIWLLDSGGLVHLGRTDIQSTKRRYAKQFTGTVTSHETYPGRIMLDDVVRNIHPTILVGTSAQKGAFTEEIVREMAQHVERPIIFPLSNPTSKSEAIPAALIEWSEGRALVATGSPFPPVRYAGRDIQIGQCNNVFIFPGVGLGLIATHARRVTDAMFIAAARALSELAPIRHDPTASLFPSLQDVRTVSRQVALAVGAEAQRAGFAEATTPEELARRVDAAMWTPRYSRLRRASD